MNRRILIVDDEEIIATLLKKMLEEEGIVEWVANGRDALAKIMETFYDVIIVDMNMPVMDGRTFYCEAVKSFSAIRERIIFFTSALEERHLFFIRENNLRYLTKPSGLKDMSKAVREIFSRNHTG
jgi:DNA-binding response OmpR family regulator